MTDDDSVDLFLTKEEQERRHALRDTLYEKLVEVSERLDTVLSEFYGLAPVPLKDRVDDLCDRLDLVSIRIQDALIRPDLA